MPLPAKRKYGPRSNSFEVLPNENLTGKTYVVTGTTNGIGIETARTLALKNGHVVMLNRNRQLAEELRQKIVKEKANVKIDIIDCDLSSLKSVKLAAQKIKDNGWPIHALILNAGVAGAPQKFTKEGYENTFGVNHVAHSLLIRELLPIVRNTPKSRIVVVASHSHRDTDLKPTMPLEQKLSKLIPTDAKWSDIYKYSCSKLCNVLMAMRLHRMEHQNGITVSTLHPGTMITTNIMSSGYPILGKIVMGIASPFTKNLSQGAATTVYCAASDETAEASGFYWESCWNDEKNLLKSLARDEALQDALWQKTEEILDKFEAENR